MKIRSVVRSVAIVALLSLATTAQAEWANGVVRWLGVGWSDGYHSHYACPPRHVAAKKQTAEKLPWWAIPAADAQPAISTGPTGYPPAGASLFRSPGEGSSVIVSDKLP